MESTIYTVNGKEFELQHYGVKGMKWGRRKARVETSENGRRGSGGTTSPDANATKRARRRKALAIGAAVVGTALAAYGAKKASDVLKNKAYQKALERGRKATADLIKTKVHTDYMQAVYEKDWRKQMKVDDQITDLARRLTKSDIAYAERASKNTIAAIRELRGKNYEIPLATLKKMGIKTFDPYS